MNLPDRAQIDALVDAAFDTKIHPHDGQSPRKVEFLKSKGISKPFAMRDALPNQLAHLGDMEPGMAQYACSYLMAYSCQNIFDLAVKNHNLGVKEMKMTGGLFHTSKIPQTPAQFLFAAREIAENVFAALPAALASDKKRFVAKNADDKGMRNISITCRRPDKSMLNLQLSVSLNYPEPGTTS